MSCLSASSFCLALSCPLDRLICLIFVLRTWNLSIVLCVCSWKWPSTRSQTSIRRATGPSTGCSLARPSWSGPDMYVQVEVLTCSIFFDSATGTPRSFSPLNCRRWITIGAILACDTLLSTRNGLFILSYPPHFIIHPVPVPQTYPTASRSTYLRVWGELNVVLPFTLNHL